MDRRLKLSVLQTPTRNKNKTHEFPKHSNKIVRAGRQCSTRCSSSLSFSYEESIKWLISCYFFVLEEHPQFWEVNRSEGFRSSGLNASNFTDDDKVESKFYWSEPGKSCNHNAISHRTALALMQWSHGSWCLRKTRETNETQRRKK